jgi:thioredoxin reductase (NADPH)
MPKPILLAVHEHLTDREALQQELTSRYSTGYEIICEASPVSALKRLDELRATAEADVLILFADSHMATMPATDFLERAHELHPHAQRVLLIPWNNRSASKSVLRMISRGRFDQYTTVPRRSPDENFHYLVTELLRDWQQQHPDRQTVVTLIDQRWSPRSYQIRDLLQRGGLPFAFHGADSPEGQALLGQVGRADGPFPVLIRYDGQVLTNPTIEQIAHALGVRHASTEGVFDVVVVGAGPAGLSAAVYAASEGLRTIVVDRESIGGQASTSSLIRNYLGFPLGVSGADLCNRALDQAWSFGAETSVLREVTDVRVDRDHLILGLADGAKLSARAVVLATGATYQRLGVPRLEALVGAGVFYGGGTTEAPAMTGQHVFVVGAGNSAGQAAVHLAKYAQQVTMIVRGADLGASMSDYLVKRIETTQNIDVRLRTTVVDGHGSGRLQELVLHEDATGRVETLPAAALFVLIGASPHTDWLPKSIDRDDKGFILTGQDLPSRRPGESAPASAPLPLETSVPGVFAAGDVRHGSVKRVASAVGEGSISIRSVHHYLSPLV